jgi:hypothetical protein
MPRKAQGRILVLAGVMVGMLGAAGRAAADATQVGVVAAVHGTVRVARPPAEGRAVASGEPLFLGDAVTTEDDGQLQILLLDETVFTIGPRSAVVIDEFVYDPATDAGKISAQILKGVFRFVTGRIAHKNPEQMKVRLPAGLIGVRGTCVSGRVEGERSTVALIGPGSITVENAAQHVEVSRTGFGTVIGGMEAPPAPPAFVPPAEMVAMAQSLGAAFIAQAMPPGTLGPVPAGAPAPGAEGQPQAGPMGPFGPQGPVPGAPGAEGQQGEGVVMYGPMGPVGAQGMWGMPGQFGPQMGFGMPMPGMMPPGGFYGFGPYGFIGPPPGAFQFYGQFAAQQASQIIDGLAKFDQLRTIQTGIFNYTATKPDGFHQLAPTDRFGPMHVQVDIDFGARTIGGGNSRMRVQNGLIGPAGIDETLPIAPQSFASGNNDAIFTQTSSGNTLTATLKVHNVAGVIGRDLIAEANYTNGPKSGTGVIDKIQRVQGASPP